MKRWVLLVVAGLGIAVAAEYSNFERLQTLLLSPLSLRPTTMTFSPDGGQLLMVAPVPSWNIELTLWDIKTHARIWQKRIAIPENRSIQGATFISDRIRIMFDNLEGFEFSPKTGQVSTVKKMYPALSLDPDLMQTVAVHGSLLAYSRGKKYRVKDATEVILVSLETGQQVGLLPEAHGVVQNVAFSPDGRTLAVARSDRRVSLWDVTTQTKLRNLRGIPPDTFEQFWVDLNQRLVISQSRRSLHVWNAQSGQLLYRLLIQGPFLFALSHTRDELALSLESGGVHILDLSSNLVKTRLGFPVRQVVFSNDGRKLFVLSADSRIRFYLLDSAGQYQLQEEQVLEIEPHTMAWLEARQELLLAVYANQNLALYNPKTHSLTRFRVEKGSGEPLLPMDDGQVLVGGYGILDLESRKVTVPELWQQCSLPPRLRLDLELLVCLEPKRLSLKRLDGTMVWEQFWPVENPYLLHWSPSGKRLATTWLKDQITILNARTGKTEGLLKAPPPDPENGPLYIRQLLFSPDEGLFVALYGDFQVRYFDLGVRRELAMPPELKKAGALQFTPDGRLMTQDQHGLHFWRVPKAKIFLP